MNPQDAFEKYGFSLPETALESLLLMVCVPELDFRRAARMHMMTLLFPCRCGTTEALQRLDEFLQQHGAKAYADVMRMSLFKHFESLERDPVYM